MHRKPPMAKRRVLRLVRERKFADLIAPPRAGAVFEASGVITNGAHHYVVLDNVRRVVRVAAHLRPTSADHQWVGTTRQGEGYEAITYGRRTRRFYLMIRGAEASRRHIQGSDRRVRRALAFQGAQMGGLSLREAQHRFRRSRLGRRSRATLPACAVRRQRLRRRTEEQEGRARTHSCSAAATWHVAACRAYQAAPSCEVQGLCRNDRSGQSDRRRLTGIVAAVGWPRQSRSMEHQWARAHLRLPADEERQEALLHG